jgi:hypothetical protein
MLYTTRQCVDSTKSKTCTAIIKTINVPALIILACIVFGIFGKYEHDKVKN